MKKYQTTMNQPPTKEKTNDTQHGDPEKAIRKEPQEETVNTPEREIVTIAQGERPGFIVGPQQFCEELVRRATGTVDGKEPWRKEAASEEVVFHLNDCGNQGSSVLGNHLSRWYAARMIASDAGVTIIGSCDSDVTNEIPLRVSSNDTIIDDDSFSWRSTCERCVGKDIVTKEDVEKDQNGCYYGHGIVAGQTPLEYAVPTIQSDLRKMARRVVRREKGLELDEVTIHIRVEDIGRQEHSLYGLVPYKSYADLIPPSAKSIGIVCAPFRQKRADWGFGDAELKEGVVLSTRDYIQDAFPNARVTVRNNATENFDMVYTRMVLSNRTICGSSTFCLYPALASIGESFIFHSPLFGEAKSWLSVIDEKFPSIHYVDQPFVLSRDIYDLNVSEILLTLSGSDDKNASQAS